MLSFKLYVYETICSAECWTFISQWSKFHFPIFLLPKPKVLIFSVSLCAKFGDLKPTIDEKQRPQILACFWERCSNNIPQGYCDFLSTKYFKNSTDHCDQQILLLKTRNLELCFGPNVGSNHAKLRRSWFIERFSSDSCVLWSVPYDVKLIRATRGAERDPLALTQSKCWGTCCVACAVSRSMWPLRTRAPKWEHISTTGRYHVNDCNAQEAAWWLTRKRDQRAGNKWTKLNLWMEKPW